MLIGITSLVVSSLIYWSELSGALRTKFGGNSSFQPPGPFYTSKEARKPSRIQNLDFEHFGKFLGLFGLFFFDHWLGHVWDFLKICLGKV